MSHVAAVELEIKDIACLKAACKAVGLEVREKKTYKWYGRWVNDYNGTNAAYKSGIDPKDYGKCEFALGVPGNASAYEIGVVKKADGTYALVWDFWNGGYGLQKVAGDNCKNLTHAYTVEVAKKQLKSKGYSLQSKKVLADGSTELVFTSY